MKKTIVIILFNFFLLSAYSQHIYKLDLNHVASITFPDTPKTKPNSVGIISTLVFDGKLYIAQVTPFHKSFKDLFTTNLNDSVFSGVIKGSLNSSKGKLLYKKNITVNGLDGVEFCYTAKIGDVNYYRYHQTFCFNKTLVLYALWSKDSLRSDSKDLKSFFRTFKLNSNNVGGDDSTAYQLGHIAGKAIGVIIVIGFFILVGFGVIFIIKKFIYK